jgi:hypothetical protein
MAATLPPLLKRVCYDKEISVAIPQNSILRVARPTDRLDEIASMYVDGLGFEVIGEFRDHDGFDGKIIGHPHQPYHLEFTHHSGVLVGNAPTKDNLLVFYIPEKEDWLKCCARMQSAGFVLVESYNPYWDQSGQTFEDLDGYRVVLAHDRWVPASLRSIS